jgi:hypothetical protein
MLCEVDGEEAFVDLLLWEGRWLSPGLLGFWD